jgi:hypothetical protein
VCPGFRLIDHWSSTAVLMITGEGSQYSGGKLKELAQVVEGLFWRNSFLVVESLGVSRTEGALGGRHLSSRTRHRLVQ